MKVVHMMIEVASAESINAIGRDMAEAIFYALANDERPSGRVLVEVANLSDAIGRDKAEAIFNHLVNM